MHGKSLQAIVFGAALVLVGTPSTSVADQANPCGPDNMPPALRQLIPQEYHGANFRPACSRHDRCYVSGPSRRQCDQRFKRDLLKACECSDRPIRCRIVARTMYRATAMFGRSYYRASRR